MKPLSLSLVAPAAAFVCLALAVGAMADPVTRPARAAVFSDTLLPVESRPGSKPDRRAPER